MIMVKEYILVGAGNRRYCRKKGSCKWWKDSNRTEYSRKTEAIHKLSDCTCTRPGHDCVRVEVSAVGGIE